MKKLSEKVQSEYNKLMQQKSKEEKEERELHEKHEHVNVLYTMTCNLLQLKNCANADNSIEKLQFELEQDKKYSWGTPFNGNQPMSNFECCQKLKQCIGIRQSFSIINLESS